MTILQRVKNFLGIEKRTYSYPGSSFYHFFNDFGLATSEAGEHVSVNRGSRISQVYKCVNVIAQDVAKLPFNALQDVDRGTIIKRSDPVHRLINTRPNNYTSSFNFKYQVVWQMLTHGNAYAIIERGSNQRPQQLHLCDPNHVKPILVVDEVYYEIKNEDKAMVVSQDNILHFKMYSFDGVKGVSPIVYNAEAMGYRLGVDKYKAKVLGSKPPGILSVDRDLSEEQYDQLINMWKRQTAGRGAGETAVMGAGMKYTPLMIPPSEGQMIEAMKLSNQDIAGIYRVPPTVIQDYDRATFSNAEQQQLVYKDALLPVTCVIEQECDFKLFGSRTEIYTKFDYTEFLRTDIKTRTEFYRAALTHGFMTINEVREKENMPSVDWGDMALIQGALVPAHMAEEKNAIPDEPVEEQARKLLEKIANGKGN